MVLAAQRLRAGWGRGGRGQTGLCRARALGAGDFDDMCDSLHDNMYMYDNNMYDNMCDNMYDHMYDHMYDTRLPGTVIGTRGR